MYTPPFTISTKAIHLIADISAQIERYVIRMEQEDALLLRKINRIKTIQGSLAIEGNTLSESQITDIIEGKHIIAPIREIQEVRLHPIFEHLPVENMIFANQQAYYNAINRSTDEANSGVFIDFMLQEIYNTLKD